jgi:GWxTD domain-containing protein
MRTKSVLLLLIPLLWIGLGCSSTNVNIERGNAYTFAVGYPEVRVSAIGIISDEDEPIISTATEIIYGSLVYKNLSGDLIAEALLEIKVTNIVTGSVMNYNEELRINKKLANSKGINTYSIIKDFFVDPGSYQVVVTVTDRNSLKDISVVTETSIPDPANPEINLTSVLLLSKNNESLDPSYFPITTYDVPQRMDSLRFEFQVTNNDSREPLTVRARLIQFESDTMPATPMSFNNYVPNTLRYTGIDIYEKDVIVTRTRQLLQSGSVYIEFTYPMLERGNYRFEVTTQDKDGDEIYKARDFSIKSDNYPEIKTVKELAAPLVYLMSDKEFEQLMSIEDEQTLKSAIDRFWLSNIENPNIAKEVIELYYDRVEEANKLFSSFKEGWKTDTGMIYILFGYPWYVEESTRRMVWSYSYDRNDPYTNFLFTQPKTKSKFFPFEHFILRRTSDYFNLEYNQQQLWLSGLILRKNL